MQPNSWASATWALALMPRTTSKYAAGAPSTLTFECGHEDGGADHGDQRQERGAEGGQGGGVGVDLAHVLGPVEAFAASAGLPDHVSDPEEEEHDADAAGGHGQYGASKMPVGRKMLGREAGTLATGMQKEMAGAMPRAAIIPTLRGRLAAFIRGSPGRR